MDIVELIEFHEINMSNLDDIIDSIKEYLETIQNMPRFRDEHNRSDSIKSWLNIFISCRVNLSNEMVRIAKAFYKAKDLYQENEKEFIEFKKFIKELPQIVSDNGTFQSSGFFPEIRQTNTSNINPIEVWDKRVMSKNIIISNFWDNVESAVLNYNIWVAKTESCLMLKHYDMNIFEGVLRGLFEERTLALQLYNGIKNNKFYHISIPASLSNNILK